MKALNDYISEKLIINKDFKLYDIYELENEDIIIDVKKNQPWVVSSIIKYSSKSDKDLFSIFSNFIRENKIKTFRTRNNFLKNNLPTKYLAAVNADIKNLYVFHEITKRANKRKEYTIYSFFINSSLNPIFKCVEPVGFDMVYPYMKESLFNTSGVAEFYEISEATYNEIKSLFDRIVNK